MCRAVQAHLVFIFLSVILLTIDESAAIKRPKFGFLTRSPDKCQDRCKRRHGFFVNIHDPNDIKPVSTGKLILKFGCHCGVSRALRHMIRKKFGRWNEIQFQGLQFVFAGKYARKKFTKKGIIFVPFKDLQKWEEKKQSMKRQESESHYNNHPTATIIEGLIKSGHMQRSDLKAIIEKEKITDDKLLALANGSSH